MRTAQELFDVALNQLRQQKQKSFTWDAPDDMAHYTCRYHSPDGMKCPVGALIPDAVYKPEMENQRVELLVLTDLLPSELKEEFVANLELLRKLQDIHDHERLERWEDSFYLVSKKFNLKYATP
jgi:hypothetical protein